MPTLCKDDTPCHLPECKEHGCMSLQMSECQNCHNANKYGDYEGPTCEACDGLGFVKPALPMRDQMDDLEKHERFNRSHWRCSACGRMHPLAAHVCEPCMDKALAEDQKNLEAMGAVPLNRRIR
jgi:DnaJ-class molecular chaperone